MVFFSTLLVATFLCLSGSEASRLNPRTASELRYSRAHSVGTSYQFEARNGWESVNITDLQYKYSQTAASTSTSDVPSLLEARGKESKSQKSPSNISNTVKHALDQVWKGLKGIGSLEKVKITWYTGQDLENPSCWPQSGWAPSDASFACALTLEGWSSKPQCFKFLELCNGPKKCVFVRVVDSCAGCSAGSKHVDLTKAAFGELASYDEGTLSVQMRLATEPTEWFEHLWGPQK